MTQPGTFDHHHPERLANVLTVPPTGLFACATLTLTVKTQNRISICVQRQVAEQDAVRARIRQRMVDLLGDDGVLAVPSAASVALPQVGFCIRQVLEEACCCRPGSIVSKVCSSHDWHEPTGCQTTCLEQERDQLLMISLSAWASHHPVNVSI